MNSQKKTQQIIQDNHLHRRIIAFLVFLSVCAGFIMPYMGISPGFAETNGVYFESQQKTIPDGAAQLQENFITKFEPENPDKIDNDGTKAEFRIELNYANMSGVDLSQPYIYYQLPSNIDIVKGGFYGSDKRIWDEKYQNGPAGYYSISEDGLIVIKFTDSYIEEMLGNSKNRQFQGGLKFDATLGRAATADGDQTVSVGGNEFVIEFDDIIKPGSKNSSVQYDNDGTAKIHYVINIKNPGKLVDLSNYELYDSMFKGDVRNWKVNPSCDGTMDKANGKYVFNSSPDAEDIQFEYDYYPTSDELLNNQGKFTNNAQIINKNPDKSSDRAETSSETQIQPSDYKAKVVKSGAPDYEKDGGELGLINWKIEVSRPHNFPLKGYTVEDTAFSSDDIQSLTLVDGDGRTLVSGTDYTINGSKIEFLTNADKVVITYKTSKAADGTDLKGSAGADVKNNAKVYPPNGSNTPDDDKTTSVHYSEKSSLTKTAETPNADLTLKPTLSPSESETITLDWQVKITDFSNFSDSSKTFTDTLQDGQFLTEEQFNAIKVGSLVKDTDYSIRETKDADGKITGFTITFLKPTDSRTQTITYSSTADVSDISNGGYKNFKNSGKYGDDTSTDASQTVNRGNLQGSQNIKAYKNWEDAPSTHPDAFLLLQYSTDNVNWSAVKANSILNPQRANGEIIWWNLPTTDPATGKPLYYRVVEITEKSANDGSYSSDTNGEVPEGYKVSYSDPSYQADGTEKKFNVTNTYNKMSISVNKTWSGVPEGTKVPDITFRLLRSTDNVNWTEVATKTLKSGETAFDFSELEKEDGNGNLYYYKVEEAELTGYIRKPDTSDVFSKHNAQAGFTNVYDQVEIRAHKKWLNDESDTSGRKEITVRLQESTDNSTWTDVTTVQTLTLNQGNDWYASWKDLPKYKDGKVIYYRIKEETTVDGYIELNGGYSNSVNSESGSYTLECDVSNEWDKINITPVKAWDGDSGDVSTRGNSVTMKLQIRHKNESGGWIDEWTDYYPEGENEITVSKPTNTNSSTWETDKSWNGLSKEDSTGKCYYRASEVASSIPEGYDTKPDEDGTNSTGKSLVKNYYKYIRITASKTWAEDSPQDRDGLEVIFTLQKRVDGGEWKLYEADGVKNPVSVAADANAGVTSQTSPEWEWKNLPKQTSDGKTIYYRVIEDTISGYTTSYSYDENNGVCNSDSSITVTNTKLAKIEKTALVPIKPEYNDWLIKENFTETNSITVDSLTDVPTVVTEVNGVSQECYLFPWKVTLNGKKADYIDTLPPDTVLYRSTDYPLIINAWNRVFAENNNWAYYLTYPYDNDPQKVRFKFNDVGITYFIYYTATPKSVVDEAVKNSGSFALKNTIAHNGSDSGSEATLTIGKNSSPEDKDYVIDKKYDADKGNNKAFGRAGYSIYVNSRGDNLSNENFLDITDEFEITGYNDTNGSGLLDAVLNSICVFELEPLNPNNVVREITDFSYNIENKTVEEATPISFTDNGGENPHYYHFNAEGVSTGDYIRINLQAEREVTLDAKTWNVSIGGTKFFKLSEFIGTDELKFEKANDCKATFTIKIPDGVNNSSLTISCGPPNVKINCISAEKIKKIVKNILHIQVPDEKHLRIDYTYEFKTNSSTPGNPKIGQQPYGWRYSCLRSCG